MATALRLLKGCREISEYMGVHPDSVTRWARLQDFPLVRMHDGGVCTTTSLIAAWLEGLVAQKRWG